jgi:hypothetical protein
MDLWGLPLGEAEEPLLHSSYILLLHLALLHLPLLLLRKKTKRNLAQLLREIPHYEDVVFEPLKMAEPFPPTIELPPEVKIESPYSLFALFFSDDLIALLSSNTNKYAKTKHAGQSGREWHKTTTSDIEIFLAILIYIGVYISPSDKDYWLTDEEPLHMPRRFIGLNRFEQIKRFFYVADPDPEAAI